MNTLFPGPAPAAAAAAMLLLAGCAAFSPDGGAGQMVGLVQQRSGVSPVAQRSEDAVQAAQARIAELLQQPLTADAAVELAFLNNRGLQASFSELGMAEADLVQAGRLRNPAFSFGRVQAARAGVEIDRSLVFDVLGLLSLPLATQLAQGRFEQAQLQAALVALAVAADARKAFYTAVAAQELLVYHGQVQDAAEAAHELAGRMLQAGNFSKLAQLREQAFYADATAQLLRARQQLVVDRERLVRVLGLSGAQLGFRLPERLPALPAEPAAPQDAEQAAMDQRLDVQLARRAAAHTAQALGLSQATRFVNVLELGYQDKRSSGAAPARGPVVTLELPLFDFGSARVAHAEAVYMQAVHQAAQVAVQARSELREAHAAYRSRHALALHQRDTVVPLRKRISEENLLRYNGMLIGVFELLADARDQVGSVTGYVEALRDFWLADTDLQATLAGRSASVGP